MVINGAEYQEDHRTVAEVQKEGHLEDHLAKR